MRPSVYFIYFAFLLIFFRGEKSFKIWLRFCGILLEPLLLLHRYTFSYIFRGHDSYSMYSFSTVPLFRRSPQFIVSWLLRIWLLLNQTGSAMPLRFFRCVKSCCLSLCFSEMTFNLDESNFYWFQPSFLTSSVLLLILKRECCSLTVQSFPLKYFTIFSCSVCMTM